MRIDPSRKTTSSLREVPDGPNEWLHPTADISYLSEKPMTRPGEQKLAHLFKPGKLGKLCTSSPTYLLNSFMTCPLNCGSARAVEQPPSVTRVD